MRCASGSSRTRSSQPSSERDTLRRQDNENDIFVIDPENREIQRWSAERYERWDEAPPIPGEKPLETWTFDAFKGG